MTTASELTARPMNLLSVEFPELYARHLCRHSQFGINVVHLAAVFGTWLSLYGIALWLFAWLGEAQWVLAALAAVYVAMIAFNVPFRVLLATGLFVGLLLGVSFTLPDVPVWVYVLLIPVWYKVQAWSHKVWNVERDMTEFSVKYRKGALLFVVLTVYEAPILLNYLFFDPRSWAER
jgi:hypothetical protein